LTKKLEERKQNKIALKVLALLAAIIISVMIIGQKAASVSTEAEEIQLTAQVPVEPTIQESTAEEILPQPTVSGLVEQKCPIDPGGDSPDNLRGIILSQVPPELAWVDLTSEYQNFALKNTQVNAKLRGESVNLEWHDLTGNHFLGFQFIEKTQGENVWDVYFAFQFHPNFVLEVGDVVRMAACGQTDAVFLRRLNGWQLAIEKMQ